MIGRASRVVLSSAVVGDEANVVTERADRSRSAQPSRPARKSAGVRKSAAGGQARTVSGQITAPASAGGPVSTVRFVKVVRQPKKNCRQQRNIARRSIIASRMPGSNVSSMLARRPATSNKKLAASLAARRFGIPARLPARGSPVFRRRGDQEPPMSSKRGTSFAVSAPENMESVAAGG